MLNIIYGTPLQLEKEYDNFIYDTRMYFDNTYDDNWITSDFSKEVIKDVDKSEVLDKNCIMSYYDEQIPPTLLSGGVKSLLLMKYDNEIIVNASTCGDNCIKWILKIAEEQDLTVVLLHNMIFGDGIRVKVVNSNKIIDNNYDLIMEASKYLDKVYEE